jgi:8-oxo-dGTP pyrophosphatase MutT (NUDIX family)
MKSMPKKLTMARQAITGELEEETGYIAKEFLSLLLLFQKDCLYFCRFWVWQKTKS